jgi:hypothetical protein
VTDTMEVVDLSTIVNMNDEAKCEYTGLQGQPEVTCDAAAEWVTKFDCGHSQLLCTPHLATFEGAVYAYCNCGERVRYDHVEWHHV